MPYGLPNETPEQTEKMESCVEQVMAKHKGEEGFTKENAIKICKSQIMGTLIEIVQDPSEINAVLGGNYLPGELLRWENMELAAAGVNGNQDELSDEQITSIATTLPLMPLDDDHRQNDVVGIFTAAQNADGRLLTDGIIYARRFPEVATDVVAGRRFPSIEAHADIAVCSICGGEFATTGEYCDHLRNKFVSGAVRSFKGEVRGVGGAVVRNPAHKAAAFDTKSIYLVAAHEVDAARGEGQGAGGPRQGDGGAGMCVCPECGAKAVHKKGNPCSDQKCPKCGASMVGSNEVTAEDKKKWSKDVKLDEGSLTALGWPSGEKIASAIKSGKVSYAKAIQKLNYLANVSKDSATASKARSIIKMLQSRFGDNKSEGGDMNTVEEVQAELDDALSKLIRLEEERDELRATNETLQASLDDAESKAEQLGTELESLRTANTELVEAQRRNMFKDILTDEEFAEQKDVIMAMSEGAVTLFAAKAKPPKAPGPTEPKVNLDPPEDDDITLA
jgi:hypothetical protein